MTSEPSRHFSIAAVDAHAEGQHGRVVLGGVGILDAPGANMFEKMKYFEQHADWFRKFMLREPRGYPAACVNVVLPSTNPEADAGFVIMAQTDRYQTMSGSNTLIVTTVILETGILPMEEPMTELTLEAPAGLVRVRAACEGGRVRSVTFTNVPSMVFHLDAPVEVTGLGTVRVDVSYGGIICAQADAGALGFHLDPDEGSDQQEIALRIIAAANEQLSAVHPTNPEISAIEGLVLYGPPHISENSARGVTVNTAGQMDRAPCGGGTSARMATLHAKGQLRSGELFRHEGPLDTVYVGRIVDELEVGGLRAIVPELTGRTWITAFSRYVLAEDDPFPEGLMMADIWPRAHHAERISKLAD
jgi:proline racemase